MRINPLPIDCLIFFLKTENKKIEVIGLREPQRHFGEHGCNLVAN